MNNLCWALIFLAAIAYAVGAVLAFSHQVFLLAPEGYWRGSMGFLIFAIALRLMQDRK